MRQINITAAQAIAANMDASRFYVWTHIGNAKRTIQKIYKDKEQIKVHQYWSQYGWLDENIDDNTNLIVIGQREEPLEIENALTPPGGNKPIKRRQKRRSNLFSLPLGPFYLESLPKKLSHNHAITAIVIYEVFAEHLHEGCKSNFAKSLNRYLEWNGTFSLREYALLLAPYVDEAYIIADSAPLYRCSNLAWDFEFVPMFLKIALDENFELKSEWQQIAHALGEYLSPISPKAKQAVLYQN